MSHKSTRFGQSISDFQIVREQESYGAQLIDRARSTVDSVQEHVSNHVGFWTGIGIAAGVAAYLFGTEQGRKISRQIGNVLGDSLNVAKDTLTDSFIKLRDTTLDVVNRTISEVGKETREMHPRLRRVV